MHDWNNKNVDWYGISKSAEEIAMFLRKWGRVSVRDYKEKWGTVRVYLSLGWSQLHSITHPGHVYSRYPQWLWSFDCRYLCKVVRLLNVVVLPYHAWLYRLAYKQALMKRPHLTAEILSGADFDELLTGLFPEWDAWRAKRRLQQEEKDDEQTDS